MKHLESFESLSFNTPMQNHYFGESEHGKHYMFYQNLKNIQRSIDDIMGMDKEKLDHIIGDGHDWAEDHVSVAMENIEQVHSFLMGRSHDEVDHNSDDHDEEDHDGEDVEMAQPEDEENEDE